MNCQNDFIFVKSKRRNRRKNNTNSAVNPCDSIDTNSKIDTDKVISKIKESQFELQSSDYYINFLEHLKGCINKIDSTTSVNLICLGLGHFSDCAISRFQLALSLLLQKELKVELAEYYDPVFTEGEQKLLQHYNCTVLTENLEGKYSTNTEGVTIFYLPHCPKQITNNILWKNWSKNSLKRTIFVSNSFTNILTTTPLRLLEITANYIIQIQEFATEIELNNNFKFTDIFNDTSIHIFEGDKLNNIEQIVWQERREPEYSEEDTELIDIKINELNIN